jgi:hypothetical protein
MTHHEYMHPTSQFNKQTNNRAIITIICQDITQGKQLISKQQSVSIYTVPEHFKFKKKKKS